MAVTEVCPGDNDELGGTYQLKKVELTVADCTSPLTDLRIPVKQLLQLAIFIPPSSSQRQPTCHMRSFQIHVFHVGSFHICSASCWILKVTPLKPNKYRMNVTSFNVTTLNDFQIHQIHNMSGHLILK